jgi:hypothetical protein
MAEAESSPILVITSVLGPIVGGAIVWLANWYNSYRIQIRKETHEDEDITIARLNKLLERNELDRKECREENQRLKNELDELKLLRIRDASLLERAIAWIKHLEYYLDKAGISHPKWDDDSSNPYPFSGLTPKERP